MVQLGLCFTGVWNYFLFLPHDDVTIKMAVKENKFDEQMMILRKSFKTSLGNLVENLIYRQYQKSV